MNREDFFNDTDEKIQATVQSITFKQTWKKIEAYEQKIGKMLDDGYTKAEYIELFNSMLARSTYTFFNHKKIVTCYIRYLVKHGILPEEQLIILRSVNTENLSIKDENKEQIRYFRNLSHLRSAIDRTVKEGKEQGKDKLLYDVPSAILYLAWFGLTEEQILSLPKTAILENGIMLDGNKIEMPYFVTELLNRLQESEGFTTPFKGNIMRRYKPSDYLIRTQNSSQLNLQQMRSSLCRMNKVMDGVYSLTYETAKESGIFYRAYMKECEGNDIDPNNPRVLSELLEENLMPDITNADAIKKYRNRLRDYTRYKELFT